MTTRATMQTEILADLRRSSAQLGSQTLSAISAAIKFYQPQRFWFNESRSVTFNTVQSQSVYTFGTSGDITTEFYRIDGGVITEDSDNRPLRRGDYVALETMIDGNSTEGRPTRFAYIAKSLRLYPVPDAAYAVRLFGHIKLAEPENDNDTGNDWFVEAYELIKCRAKAYLGAHVLMDLNMAAVMRAAEQDAFKALKKATTDKVATGTLVPTQW